MQQWQAKKLTNNAFSPFIRRQHYIVFLRIIRMMGRRTHVGHIAHQNLDSKLNAALQQIVYNIGGLHFYFTFYTPTCHWSTPNSAKTLKAEHLLNKFRQDTG